ncbi:hypothetical protein [Alteromonas sp. MmMcT2-5]|uniref:hypothetical protein n=1 Tax=Alteromonas sp. MmMcT2-5 TaxID=2917733 RepID=UPI001EF24D53|nr:hypothetical protein [Alteromonas sp. MmMcT2-5]MCG7651610.1 hypothetical protein [Alteromonas sp. MmMcT2-5]
MKSTNYLSKETEQKLVKFLNISDKNRHNIFATLNLILSDLYIPLKPSSLGEQFCEVDFKRNDRKELTSAMAQLQKVLNKTEELKNELQVLKQKYHSLDLIVSEHIGINLNKLNQSPNAKRSRIANPAPILDAIYDACVFVSEDHRKAYSGKWNKFFDELEVFWEITLGKDEATSYENGSFLNFLNILTGIDNDTLKRAHSRYRNK